ncbi:MAG: glycosyltransferase [Chloroflexi bacterium]|nr:glycosyltransferase [Chloroflexota bacterium]
MNPFVSVVVPCYNSAETIGPCLDSLLDQTYAPFEVIVVDDGSTDDTAAIARRHAVRVIEGDHKGTGAARNLGWRQAKGDIIVFAESDGWYSRDYLQVLVAPLRDPAVGGSIAGLRRVWTGKDTPLVRLQNYRWLSAVRLIHHGERETGVWAYRKTDLERLGGFREDLFYVEDWDLARRLRATGARTAFVPHAEFRHRDPTTWRAFTRRQFWNGANEKQKDRLLNAVPSLPGKLAYAGVSLVKAFSLFGPALWNAERRGTLRIALERRDLGALLVAPLFFWLETVSFACGRVASWVPGLLRRPADL